MKSLRSYIRLFRPIYLLIAILLYFLGIGINHYINGQINWQSFFLGLAWLLLIILGYQFLNEYFDRDPVADEHAWWHTPFSGSTGTIGKDKISRLFALWAGLTCITIAASLTVIFVRNDIFSISVLIMVGLIFFGEMVFAIPPLRLVASGYGELVMAIVRVAFIPAFAYALQEQELHRLLIMVSFPLVPLYLAMLMALELPVYATDSKYGMRSIITRIGWQRGMLLHNILILMSFVLLGIAFAFGLPLKIGWPVFIVLPIGLLQIWMMNRIAEGVKPNWNILILGGLSTFILATYVLTFAFWIN